MISADGEQTRTFIEAWHRQLILDDVRELKGKIKLLLDGQQLVMFFRCRGDLYGCQENGRIVFSRMNKPRLGPGDEDAPTTDGWKKNATFVAFNLLKALRGDPSQMAFTAEDVPGVEIIGDQDALIKEIIKNMSDKEKKAVEPPAAADDRELRLDEPKGEEA